MNFRGRTKALCYCSSTRSLHQAIAFVSQERLRWWYYLTFCPLLMHCHSNSPFRLNERTYSSRCSTSKVHISLSFAADAEKGAGGRWSQQERARFMRASRFDSDASARLFCCFIASHLARNCLLWNRASAAEKLLCRCVCSTCVRLAQSMIAASGAKIRRRWDRTSGGKEWSPRGRALLTWL